jgi:hypothetical protein
VHFAQRSIGSERCVRAWCCVADLLQWEVRYHEFIVESREHLHILRQLQRQTFENVHGDDDGGRKRARRETTADWLQCAEGGGEESTERRRARYRGERTRVSRSHSHARPVTTRVACAGSDAMQRNVRWCRGPVGRRGRSRACVRCAVNERDVCASTRQSCVRLLTRRCVDVRALTL